MQNPHCLLWLVSLFLKKIRQKGKFSVTSGRVSRDKYHLWMWWVEWVARVEWVEWVVWVVWRMFMLSLFGFAPFPLPGPTLYPTVGPISPSTPFFASSDSSKALYIISHTIRILCTYYIVTELYWWYRLYITYYEAYIMLYCVYVMLYIL